MFRETDKNSQMSLFDNPSDLMGKRAVKKYEDSITSASRVGLFSHCR